MSSLDFLSDATEALKNAGFSFIIVCTQKGQGDGAKNISSYKLVVKNQSDAKILGEKIPQIKKTLDKESKRAFGKNKKASKQK